MLKIKQWLAAIATGVMFIILFGIIFVRLGIVTPKPTLYVEILIVTALGGTTRFFWYSDGEDRAAREEFIVKAKEAYGALVDSKIISQEDFSEYLKYLNYENRKMWILSKLKGRTKDNCEDYDKIYNKLVIKSYKRVDDITISEILTRSPRHQILTSKDYRNINKVFYQISSIVISFSSSIVLAALAYEELMLSWTNIFKYLSYVFSILWALVTSLCKGYRSYKNETIDHISRLTMIVNRYEDWDKGVRDKWLKEKSTQQQAIEQI